MLLGPTLWCYHTNKPMHLNTKKSVSHVPDLRYEVQIRIGLVTLITRSDTEKWAEFGGHSIALFVVTPATSDQTNKSCITQATFNQSVLCARAKIVQNTSAVHPRCEHCTVKWKRWIDALCKPLPNAFSVPKLIPNLHSLIHLSKLALNIGSHCQSYAIQALVHRDRDRLPDWRQTNWHKTLVSH